MENSGFLKSVSFGGFDKKDVLAYVDDLNTKIYTLESELEEAKSRGGDGNGSGAKFDGAEKYEQMLAKERAHVSELMAKNDTLQLTVQSNERVIADKEAEIETLKEKINDLQNNVSTQPQQEETSSYDIGSVFIEAKKSADKIISEAKNVAKKMDTDAKTLASQVVDEANAKAQSIVADADSKATKIVKEAEVKTSDLRNTSDKLKSDVLEEISKIFEDVNKINETIAEFSKGTLTNLEKTKEIIFDAEKVVKGEAAAPQAPQKAQKVSEPEKKVEVKKVEEPKFEQAFPKQQTTREKSNAMTIDEMAAYAKSLSEQIEAEAVQVEDM